MTKKTREIRNQIDATDLWKGIGGHFDSLSQILHELIDNCVSNFKSNTELPHHTILISFDTETKQKEVVITVEDTGTGIKDIDSAFTIGSQKAKETPMNEHGFGLKHALASANKKNDDWCVYTRTENEIQNNSLLKIKSSYKLIDFVAHELTFKPDDFPSFLENTKTGTIIQFATSNSMFRSIGKYGTKDPRKIIAYLKENLGFIYNGVIKSGIAEIQIKLNDDNKIIVNSIDPWWDKTIHPGNGKQKLDLAGSIGLEPSGEITLDYKFGTIKKRIAINDNEKILYYAANMQTAGVEIRLNGRVIAYNLLNEVWPDKFPHNRFNNFLVIIDLISYNSDALPATRSSKNGFRQGDERLQGLFSWIRMHCPEPYENKYSRDENHLMEDLKELKFKSLSGMVPEPLTIDLERKFLSNSEEPIRVDMFISFDEKIILYEGKTGNSSPIDLYQLKLYWDAAVIENLVPTSAVLIASAHSGTMQDLVSFNNSLKDGNENYYNFQIKSWRDEGVDYPSKEY